MHYPRRANLGNTTHIIPVKTFTRLPFSFNVVPESLILLPALLRPEDKAKYQGRTRQYFPVSVF